MIGKKKSPGALQHPRSIQRATICQKRNRFETHNTHENTPEDNNSDNCDTRRGSRDGLSESGEDDQDELKPVHALTTNNICKYTEANLA